MQIEFNKKYNVKYIGDNKDILDRAGEIMAITITTRDEPLPPKHFWSKPKYKTVYDLKCLFRTKKLEWFPEQLEGWLSRYEGINYFDTFEDAVKFVEENFVERNTDFWNEVSLCLNADLFKPILHDKSGSFILLEDTLTHNVYIATKLNSNTFSSVSPYFGRNGKILKADRFNSIKFSAINREQRGELR